MSSENINTLINAMNVTLNELETNIKQIGKYNKEFLRGGSDILGKVRYQEVAERFDKAVQSMDELQDSMGWHSFAYEPIPSMRISMQEYEKALGDDFSLAEVYNHYSKLWDEMPLEILAYHYFNFRSYLTQEDKDFLKENEIELKIS